MNHDIKPQPQNLDAERSVLGCLMLNAKTIDSVASGLKPDDFYLRGNKLAYSAILSLHSEGIEPDPVTVADKLESDGVLEEIGGASGLFEIMNSVPHSAHALHYAEIVMERSRRRKVIALAKRLSDGAYDMESDADSLVSRTVQFANSLADIAAEAAKQKISTLESETSKAAERSSEGAAAAMYVMIPEIDRALRGVALAELFILAGRPSHGKTLVGLQMIDEASSHGLPGLIISEEMSKEALADRALSFVTILSPDERYGNLQRLQYDHREYFKDRATVLIAEDCGNIAAVEREVARAVRTHEIKIVAIDYAQLLKGDGNTRYEQVSDVSRRAKRIAKKHNIIVLLLAQIGRGMESRIPPEPRASDLKDSGQLEQDADIIAFPYWPIMIDKNYSDPTEYRIYIAKNRARGIGEAVVQMRINPARQRLYPYEGGLSETPNEWN